MLLSFNEKIGWPRLLLVTTLDILFSRLMGAFCFADKFTREEITGFLSALITNVVPLFSYQPQHTNVCFWYLPPSLRNLPDGKERRERLHKVTTH